MQKGYAVSITQWIFGVEEQVPVLVRPDRSGMVTVTGLLPGHYEVSVTNNGTTTHTAPTCDTE